MQIPNKVELPMDGIPGPAAKSHVGEPRHYRQALFNTLVHLKPRVCLEIGTNLGQTSHLFQWYFNEHRPDGFLITCDVGVFNKLDCPNVHQILVYPHIKDAIGACDVPPDTMLPSATDDYTIENSAELNIAILREKLAGLGETQFDFVFLDGDHHSTSLRKDLIIAETLTKEPHYILVDDTDDHFHECADYYHEYVKPHWNSYDYYKEWGLFTGCELIWRDK